MTYLKYVHVANFANFLICVVELGNTKIHEFGFLCGQLCVTSNMLCGFEVKKFSYQQCPELHRLSGEPCLCEDQEFWSRYPCSVIQELNGSMTGEGLRCNSRWPGQCREDALNLTESSRSMLTIDNFDWTANICRDNSHKITESSDERSLFEHCGNYLLLSVMTTRLAFHGL